ncbi:SCO family protein [Vibrio natriegens]|uniref:Photosynthetic protein synthase I n=1 Tax=Vibrio natriegens NBRC 15636 = ATCC 14048 = DSM 759 TaxID=1219067 RepID=A0AAN1CY68_VIBNA|nr:SCO family protein [Vibrio natriegens]ALR17425.1 photosynthetic protein synthase I [Vibrio natriegens NBRC 15636 = ATCC 14048 = DSM 759]ANQ14916.1 photosynthetic protein synthase I [Vibrio natriegens NBRC 15636 = ATCC 14048 = DSM 759]EPM42011.1 photosynthetic protein synthase I [Vibrio natriegens NBRC 15636 = ATCC 14048 = DSM 759]MDX6029759.1 SCO family protein [Vibrio natriegens NBRC 15636 = ATCC 14048 = DSM 759]UUI13555.1 SCO family protein [Vibrio natriegens]
MSRNWSLFLVVAFVLGFGAKSYLDSQEAIPTEQTEPAKSEQTVLFGENDQPVNIFDVNDPRIRIVYFGFTRCPDVCPTSLAMLAGALNQIDESQKAQLRPMFISLDPERDEADASAKYAHYFHPMIEGLSAPLDITTPLAHSYGVIFRKTELVGSELKYTLDHSSYFYFLKPDGTLITKVPHTLTPAPIVEAISQLTSNDSSTKS